MHEAGIALAIFRQAAEYLEDAGDRLESVEVAIGELSAVDPDLLRFAWEAVVSGGAHAEAVLRVDWRPARQYCPHCECFSERPAPGWLRLCETCSGALVLSGGDELDLLRVSYQTLPAEASPPSGEALPLRSPSERPT